jgi:PAS domain S-box-containing protein
MGTSSKDESTGVGLPAGSERDLRERDERYAMATAAARVGVWDWDITGGRFYLDPNVKALLGYSDDEIPNDLEVWSTFVHPEDQEAVMKAATDHLEGRTPEYVFEHRMMHRDGSVRWFLVRGRAIRDAEGKAVRMLGTDADITQRKELEEALKRSEAQYRSLVEQLPAVTYLATPDTESSALYISPQVEAMTGFSVEEFCTSPSRWRRQLHEEDRERVIEALERSVKTGVPLAVEYRLRTKSGEIIWIRDQGSLVSGDDGEPLFYQGFMLEITAAKRMEERLFRSQKLESLGVLAGGIAHDFNNLLTVMLGNADLALERMPEGAPGHAELGQIQAASLRAKDLTGQMLTYAGRVVMVPESVDLNPLIESLSELLATAMSKKARLRHRLSPGLPPVEADPSQIQQIVMNLLTNASEALGDETGTVTISTDLVRAERPIVSDWPEPQEIPAGAYVSLEVQDSGEGMDRKTRARMFDPFYTTKFTGRGLGLAAVLGAVRQHRGGIFVESEPGRGTSVKVLIPVVEGARLPPRPDEAASPTQGPGSARTVLVIDDEAAVVLLIRSILEQEGHRVLSAGDGRRGLEVLQENLDGIDLVLLDLTMPELDGEATYSRIRDMDPKVPVVLMSGFSEADLRGRFEGRRVAGFLQKPFRAEQLVEKLGGIGRARDEQERD